MNTIRIAIVVTCLCLSGRSLSAEQTEGEAAKQAARETCITDAQERYGSAEIISEPKKKTFGRRRGYGFEMQVGEQNKRMNCFADRKGSTMFYGGQL